VTVVGREDVDDGIAHGFVASRFVFDVGAVAPPAGIVGGTLRDH
jgi:hypothetical protein